MSKGQRTRAHILDVAFNEILIHGYKGISIDQIVAKTGLTKGSFYYHFSTKEALGYALIDEVLRNLILKRWILPLEEFRDPLQGILDTFTLRMDEASEAELALGCPLNNLIQEMSTFNETFREKLGDTIEFWIIETQRHLKKAKKLGLLKTDTHTRKLATLIVGLHEVAYGFSKVTTERKSYRIFHSCLKDYIDQQRI